MRLRKLIQNIGLLLALAAAGCQALPSGSAGSQVSAPQAATPTFGNAQIEQEPAWAQVVDALDQWNKDDANAAVNQISKAQQVAGNDTAFFLHAGDMLVQANAWPLAAVMYLNLKRIQPSTLSTGELNKIHEAAYRSGTDSRAGRVFMIFTDPWLDLGRVRFELRNGQVDVASAEIQTVTSDASLLAQFPEALMVETEVFIAQQKWHEANADLDKLLAFPNLPVWITHEASQLRGLAQPN